MSADSPASRAGVLAGDKILEVNGKPLVQWEDLSQTIQEDPNRPITLQIQRGEQLLTIEVFPEIRKFSNVFGEAVQRPLIGVSCKTEIRRLSPIMAGYYSLVRTWDLTHLFFLTIVKLVQRVIPMNTLGGPILIAQMAGQQAGEGLLSLASFMAFISVNLAVINLLPIPILDGGHLLVLPAGGNTGPPGKSAQTGICAESRSGPAHCAHGRSFLQRHHAPPAGSKKRPNAVSQPVTPLP